ncbi:transposase [Patescibacteria group bacterium]|nr:transposase [Patescibacteria group bacterium]
MPRKPRELINFPDSHIHIVCRGNNQKKIFRKKQDFQKFLSILIEAKKRFHFFIFTLSLMPNHYHLQVQIKEDSISAIMYFINFRYAKYFNRLYHSSGHLFQDRFYARSIKDEVYFREVSRYIHRNPDRAHLVTAPEDYTWSSFVIYYKKCYSGNKKNVAFSEKKLSQIIDAEEFLSIFCGKRPQKDDFCDYIQFVKEKIDEKKIKKIIEPKME